jgi:phage shock protein E
MFARLTCRGLVLSLTFLSGLAAVALGQEHTKDSLETVKKALAAKKAVLVDVREKPEWDRGHLRDATLVPLSGLKDETKVILPKDKAIYLHCASGVRCVQAAEILRKQGYDARPLKAGYKDLLKEGFPKAAD